MRSLGRFMLVFAILAATLVLSGPAVATEPTNPSSATAIVDFIPGQLDYFSCYPVCPSQGSGTSPVIPPIPVRTVAECEAHCRSVCQVSSCSATPPPISSDSPEEPEP